jgi:hypothetical protein
VKPERDRARNFGARDELHRLGIDDDERGGIRVFSRADAHENTVVFLGGSGTRDEDRLAEDVMPSANEVDAPERTSTLTIEEPYSPRASGPSDAPHANR